MQSCAGSLLQSDQNKGKCSLNMNYVNNMSEDIQTSQKGSYEVETNIHVYFAYYTRILFV